IEPKPIYNKNQTKQKFRFEYLANEFDTGKSILSLPIASDTYNDMNLNEMVYTAKTHDDLYIRMEEVMEKSQFMRLKRNVMQVEGITKKDKKALQKQMQKMDQWSFLHLLSYLVYRPKIETLHLKLIEPLHKYLPEETMASWEEIRSEEVMEKSQFMRLKRNVMQVEGITKKDKKALQKQMQKMDQWSFLHLLSYLVYRPKIETLHLKLIEPLHKYLPEETMASWEEI